MTFARLASIIKNFRKPSTDNKLSDDKISDIKKRLDTVSKEVNEIKAIVTAGISTYTITVADRKRLDAFPLLYHKLIKLDQEIRKSNAPLALLEQSNTIIKKALHVEEAIITIIAVYNLTLLNAPDSVLSTIRTRYHEDSHYHVTITASTDRSPTSSDEMLIELLQIHRDQSRYRIHMGGLINLIMLATAQSPEPPTSPEPRVEEISDPTVVPSPALTRAATETPASPHSAPTLSEQASTEEPKSPRPGR